MGLPALWTTVAFWLSLCRISTSSPPEKNSEYTKKCPEVKKIQNYRKQPAALFWKKFPKFKAAKRSKSKIRLKVLKRLVQKCWFSWNKHQRKIAKTALITIKKGAITVMNGILPVLNSQNAKSAFTHGEMLTDTIAHWVKNKMVAGPFRKPPLNNFRINP